MLRICGGCKTKYSCESDIPGYYFICPRCNPKLYEQESRKNPYVYKIIKKVDIVCEKK